MNPDQCIFCKIVRRESPAYVVYEDQHFLAFLSTYPESPGHTLVIPKEHYRWVWDVPNVGAYFEIARIIAHAQQRAFGQEMILSKVVGEDVHHAHIWVFPTINTKGFKDDLEGNKNLIIEAIQENIKDGKLSFTDLRE
ncbi:MAG: HIT domain-containing protein [bacterium]